MEQVEVGTDFRREIPSQKSERIDVGAVAAAFVKIVVGKQLFLKVGHKGFDVIQMAGGDHIVVGTVDADVCTASGCKIDAVGVGISVLFHQVSAGYVHRTVGRILFHNIDALFPDVDVVGNLVSPFIDMIDIKVNKLGSRVERKSVKTPYVGVERISQHQLFASVR